MADLIFNKLHLSSYYRPSDSFFSLKLAERISEEIEKSSCKMSTLNLSCKKNENKKLKYGL